MDPLDITRAQLRSGELPIVYRSAEVKKDSVDLETRTAVISFSSEYPVERWDWVEVLGHNPDEVDLSRLQDSAPFLWGHNWQDQRGVILEAWIEGGRGYAKIKLSRNPLGEQLLVDMHDEITRNVSVGYRIENAELTKREGDTEYWRVTRWLPLEISTVSVPADPTVGLGRADKSKNTVTIREAVMPKELEDDLETPAPTKTQEQRSTPEPTPTPKPAPQVRTVGSTAPAANDAQRIAETGEQYGAVELANEFIRDGKGYESFRDALTTTLHKKRSSPEAESTLVNLDIPVSDLKRYSVIKALRGAASGNWKQSGLERSVSDAIAERQGKDPEGVYLSYEALGYGLRGQLQQRLQSAGGAGLGAELVANEHHAELFIEVLRAQAVIGGLGVRFMSGLLGNVDIPKQSGSATFYWVDEDGSAPNSDLGFTTVQMTPKTIATAVALTRRLMIQSSPDAENLVRGDIMYGLSMGIDNAILKASGVGGEPLGVLNTSGIGAVDLTGGLDWAKVVELETDCSEANADANTSAYVMRPTMRGTMKTTEKAANTGQFIWQGNEVNGYKAAVTTEMEANQILFGDFSQVMVGMWGALDVTPDKATKAASGGLVMRLFQDADIAIRHAQAFSLAS